MNRGLISKAIGDIDNRHIYEAACFNPEGIVGSPERIIPMSERKTHRAGTRRIAVLAIAACLLLALGVAAYAAGWFGLRGAIISTSNLTDQYDSSGCVGQTLVPATVVTLSGVEGTPEYQAAKEWREFYNAYVANNYNGDELHQELDAWGQEHQDGYLELYTPALAEKLRSICEKYGLTARTGCYEGADDKSYSDLAKMAGITPFLADSGRSADMVHSYRLYDDGSFACNDCWWPHDDFDNIDLAVWDIKIVRSVKGTMSTEFSEFGVDEKLDEWQYTTAAGEAVDLVLGENKALILYEGADAYVAVQWQQLKLMKNDGVDLSREGLERYADTVDFTALGSKGAVDYPGMGYGYVVPTPEP